MLITGQIILKQNLSRALDFLREEIRSELKAQGHKATGKLIEEIEVKIFGTDTELRGQILMNDYAKYVDKGVKPNKIPYSPGTKSNAKTSKYIEALMGWIRTIKSGVSEKETKSFAFAIAATAKREGHATRGSYRYSTNGRRLNFTSAIDNNQDEFLEIVNLAVYFDAVVSSAIEFQSLKN